MIRILNDIVSGIDVEEPAAWATIRQVPARDPATSLPLRILHTFGLDDVQVMCAPVPVRFASAFAL